MEYYRKKIEIMDKFDKEKDYESAGLIAQQIYKKFVRDISSEKIKDESKEIATLIKNKVVNNKNTRWFS